VERLVRKRKRKVSIKGTESRGYCIINRKKDNIEEEIISREREKLRYTEKRKIIEARYKEAIYKRYKEVLAEGVISKNNLGRINLGEWIRALVRVRYGNLREWNKYCLEEGRRKCSFCNKGRDDLLHYIEGCEEMANWFRDLGKNKEEIWEKVERRFKSAHVCPRCD